MTPDIFAFAEACLYHSSLEQLLALTKEAQQLAKQKRLCVGQEENVLPISDVLFPNRPVLLPPREMPKRKLTTPAGLAAFFHAIAHVEFVAIYLAWDMVYRFRGLPGVFYYDWLAVAYEEAEHFQLLQKKLQTYGYDYGDLPAHSGLWDLAQYSAEDVLLRLALVPRNMEAHGLDVTPPLIEKFKQLNDEEAVSLLTRILSDEVGHVALGSKWFWYVCEQRYLTPEQTFQRLIADYYRHKGGSLKGRLNYTLRQQAGFSASELAWLEANVC